MTSMDSTWHELAIETAMAIHVEQITGGAAVECHCGKDADLLVTSEPDMEPGAVCRGCGFQWIDITVGLLKRMLPVEDGG